MAALGLALVFVLATSAWSIRASVYGCVDREQGSQRASQIQKGRVAAIRLGRSDLAKVYANEEDRQQKWNAEAERRCDQPGLPFDLAMRRIDAKRDFFNLLAVAVFGFCTLGSVLIAVTLRDDEADGRLLTPGRSGGGPAEEMEIDGSVNVQERPFLNPSDSSPVSIPTMLEPRKVRGSRTGWFARAMMFAVGAAAGYALCSKVRRKFSSQTDVQGVSCRTV